MFSVQAKTLSLRDIGLIEVRSFIPYILRNPVAIHQSRPTSGSILSTTELRTLLRGQSMLFLAETQASSHCSGKRGYYSKMAQDRGPFLSILPAKISIQTTWVTTKVTLVAIQSSQVATRATWVLIQLSQVRARVTLVTIQSSQVTTRVTFLSTKVTWIKSKVPLLSTKVTWITSKAPFLLGKVTWARGKANFLPRKINWQGGRVTSVVIRLSQSRTRVTFLSTRVSWTKTNATSVLIRTGQVVNEPICIPVKGSWGTQETPGSRSIPRRAGPRW